MDTTVTLPTTAPDHRGVDRIVAPENEQFVPAKTGPTLAELEESALRLKGTPDEAAAVAAVEAARSELKASDEVDPATGDAGEYEDPQESPDSAPETT